MNHSVVFADMSVKNNISIRFRFCICVWDACMGLSMTVSSCVVSAATYSDGKSFYLSISWVLKIKRTIFRFLCYWFIYSYCVLENSVECEWIDFILASFRYRATPHNKNQQSINCINICMIYWMLMSLYWFSCQSRVELWYNISQQQQQICTHRRRRRPQWRRSRRRRARTLINPRARDRLSE